MNFTSKSILYISDSAIPSYSANSIHVMKMCQAYSKLGYSVTLIGKKTRDILRDVPDIHSFYGVEQNFQIKLFPSKPFFLSGRIYNLLIPFFSFTSPGLIYTRSIYAAFWYSLFRKKLTFEIHEPFHSKNSWLNFLFNFIVNSSCVYKWVVISQPLKQLLIQDFGIDMGLILVAHDGSDISSNKTSKDLGLKGNFKVGYVGSLLKGKGMEIIYELSKKMSHIDFHVVGGNSTQLESWKEKLEPNQDNLIFHGQKAPKETGLYIAQFDIVLAPYQREVFVKDSSQSNNLSKWMSPLKIFEYMAFGKPIIASDLPVVREILEHNYSAILCDPDHLEEWIYWINQISRSNALGSQLGHNAKRTLENKFSWDIRSRNIIDFINN